MTQNREQIFATRQNIDLLGPLKAAQPTISLGDVRAATLSASTRWRAWPYVTVALVGIGLIATLILRQNEVSALFPQARQSIEEFPAIGAASSGTGNSSSSPLPSRRVSVTPLHDKLAMSSQFVSEHAASAASATNKLSEMPAASKENTNSASTPPEAVRVDSAKADEPLSEHSFDRDYRTRVAALQPQDRVYGAIQIGTIMGSLNTLGGGISLTGSHDWMQATLRYTSTFGLSASDLFSQPIGKSASQDVREYALMFGARLEQGDFWASIEAGPNVIHASFNTFIASPRADSLTNDIGGGLGASAQATFGYRISDYLGIDLTGFVSNHSITYGGILFSVVGGSL
ncbi:MAG: hypothetical protein Q8922_04455 [Bacteroidota bacterium]|nr:hypothetical protein [Bacteroidota bacterium]MDP4231832.1 hypothetical protein [Bacteroidota bacterium]MDP4242718.1 hypothetical protein [Bacteroidota bacterium]MDP4287169.1 hypothetical protein [Bacteroidota bacterium]